MNDCEIINKALAGLVPGESMEPGALANESMIAQTAEDALKRFFDGAGKDRDGWLYEAGTNEAIRLTGNIDPDDNWWPLWGEIAWSGEEGERFARSLQRTDSGWMVTTIRREEQGPGFIRTVRRVGRRGFGKLEYEVCYLPQSIGSHQEFRPSISRFIRFVQGGKS